MEELGELLGYDELAALLGKSRGSLRVMRSRGQLPEPDGDGPRWRRSTVEAFLERGAAGRAGSSPGPSAKPADPVVQRSSVPERRGERDRWAAEQVAALQAAGRQAEPAAEPPAAVSPRPVPPPVERDPRAGMTMQEVLACVHPDGRRKSLGYMTVCQACGRRQQGDGWVGQGYAGWTPGEPAGCPRHPSATRSTLDPSRCSWGCRLPPT